MYSFQSLLAMIIFDMMEVGSIKLVTSVINEAKFHSATRLLIVVLFFCLLTAGFLC